MKVSDDAVSDEAASESAVANEAVRQALRRVLFGLHPEITVVERVGTGAYIPEQEHRGAPGWVHGGFIATVLDHLCARVARSVLDSRVATGTLDIRYRQPVLLDGGPYPIEATADLPRSQTVHVRGRILSPDGRPLSEARGLFVSRGLPLSR